MLFIKRYCGSFQHIRSIIANKLLLGKAVGVRGWIKNIRRLKNNIFFNLNDGSSFENIQIVLPNNENTKRLTSGTLVAVLGTLHMAPQGNYELHCKSVNQIADGGFKSGYPFLPKQQHPPEYVRDYIHLRSRVDYIAAIMRLRHKAQKVLHDFMDENKFVQINTPILTTNDCEGAGEVFRVQPDSDELQNQMTRPGVSHEESYFDCKVFLSVSGQLHLECMSYGLGNTYALNPIFRAENCKSPLHLSEFYMFEVELAFVENVQQLCSFIERMIKCVTCRLCDLSICDILFCQKQAVGTHFQFEWLEKTWPILTYKEALEIILQHREQFQTTITANSGFSKEQEMFLVKYCQAPVFVIDWPANQKPFYMMVSRKDPTIVHALDLFMPLVGELCGGSMREFDEKYLREHPALPTNLNWYLELRKFGGIPTGGFGMGFERYLQSLTGIKNIRDVIPFPRYPHSCKM